MPYALKKKGPDVLVVKKDTGEVVATHKPPDAEDKALAQMRLLYAVEAKKERP